MIKPTKKKLVFNGSINITSLLDVLTTLLFFLIKSMSVTTISLTTPEGMRLPASYIESAAEEAVVVSLTNSIISVDTESIMKYENYKFAKRDIASDQRTLIPLEKVLAEKYSKRQEIYVGLEDVKAENIPAPKLLIQADKELPFGTMKYLLHTVAKVGYTDYQFIVLPKE